MNHRGTEGTEWAKQELNGLSQRVIGACMEVHRTLGPGLLESAYEMALAHELTLSGLAFERQRPMPLKYKGILLDCGYRIDFVVEGKLIVEIKAVAEVLPIHHAQLLTYLKLEQKPLGLLINFNVTTLKSGIKRVVRGELFREPETEIEL